MPRIPNAPSVLATYRRVVPFRVRRIVAARIVPKLRTRLRALRPLPRAGIRPLHASVDGGDTLNIAVSVADDWADPVLTLRSTEREIELPTRISADLGGLRRAESSVRLGSDSAQVSALPVVVLEPGAWGIELHDRGQSGSAILAHDRPREPGRSRGATWAITGAVGKAVVLKEASSQAYPRLETIAIGLTTIELAGTLVGPWAQPLDVVVRLKGGAVELPAPAALDGDRFRASLPLDAMLEDDGVWECHLRGGDQTRRVLTRQAGETDRRFDIETPVRLVAASDGRLVRVRGYTTKLGGLNLSTTANVEESS